ncbi:MAG: dienelactone hydrolase family protein [Methanoregulaceae archaeon]|nr:MAG: dienelactone hydrolase family protein [Methanoregulaceae archaeon]
MNRSLLLVLCACILVVTVFLAACTNAQQGSPVTAVTTIPVSGPVPGSMTTIMAGGKTYPAYIAAPVTLGKHPGIVLLHSFNGLEPGYKEMCDRIAGNGFVVIAPEWQTFGQRAGDPEVEAVIRSSVAALQSRTDVDSTRLGLTGFCAGGRFTMLFLPQMQEFKAGVAWYGFPNSIGYTNDTAPASHITELSTPMLMIHGSRDQPSPIAAIYNYSMQLDAADKYFELKVYQGRPHGFMIANGSLVRDDVAEDAYSDMIAFFRRKL